VGFSLLSDFLPFCPFFTLLSPLPPAVATNCLLSFPHLHPNGTANIASIVWVSTADSTRKHLT
jgi:hypothetical protein